jgi:predicted nuclease with TOPRIM domain
MQEVTILNGKIDELIKQYTALLAENKRLQGVLESHTTTIDTLKSKIASLEKNGAVLDMSNVLTDHEDKDKMRKQLDNVIGEIDKILNTLND